MEFINYRIASFFHAFFCLSKTIHNIFLFLCDPFSFKIKKEQLNKSLYSTLLKECLDLLQTSASLEYEIFTKNGNAIDANLEQKYNQSFFPFQEKMVEVKRIENALSEESQEEVLCQLHKDPDYQKKEGLFEKTIQKIDILTKPYAHKTILQNCLAFSKQKNAPPTQQEFCR